MTPAVALHVPWLRANNIAIWSNLKENNVDMGQNYRYPKNWKLKFRLDIMDTERQLIFSNNY